MTVKELKLHLTNIDDDLEIIIQKDSEGNDYSPLDGIDVSGGYVPYNKWSGEMAYSEDSLSKKVLVLFPIN